MGVTEYYYPVRNKLRVTGLIESFASRNGYAPVSMPNGDRGYMLQARKSVRFLSYHVDTGGVVMRAWLVVPGGAEVPIDSGRHYVERADYKSQLRPLTVAIKQECMAQAQPPYPYPQPYCPQPQYPQGYPQPYQQPYPQQTPQQVPQYPYTQPQQVPPYPYTQPCPQQAPQPYQAPYQHPCPPQQAPQPQTPPQAPPQGPKAPRGSRYRYE